MCVSARKTESQRERALAHLVAVDAEKPIVVHRVEKPEFEVVSDAHNYGTVGIRYILRNAVAHYAYGKLLILYCMAHYSSIMCHAQKQ